jgi:hypothetical protein
MVIHCLAGNTPMLSLARRLGMTIEMSRGEADGRLKLRACQFQFTTASVVPS